MPARTSAAGGRLTRVPAVSAVCETPSEAGGTSTSSSFRGIGGRRWRPTLGCGTGKKKAPETFSGFRGLLSAARFKSLRARETLRRCNADFTRRKRHGHDAARMDADAVKRRVLRDIVVTP